MSVDLCRSLKKIFWQRTQNTMYGVHNKIESQKAIRMTSEEEMRLYQIFDNKIESIYMDANLDQFPEEERDSKLIPMWRSYLKQLDIQIVLKEDFYKRIDGINWSESVVLFNPLYTEQPSIVLVMTPEFAEKILVLGLP